MSMSPVSMGEEQFSDANGVPYAGGTVGMYIQGTLIAKDTFQDQAGTVLNANPLTLDSAGRALIWGQGSYRQILKDSLGNPVWDRPVAASSMALGVIPLTSNTNLAIGNAYGVKTLSGAFTLTLPLISSVSDGQEIDVEDIDNNAAINAITIVASGSDLIKFQANSATSFQINTTSAGARFIANGTAWRCIA